MLYFETMLHSSDEDTSDEDNSDEDSSDEDTSDEDTSVEDTSDEDSSDEHKNAACKAPPPLCRPSGLWTRSRTAPRPACPGPGGASC